MASFYDIPEEILLKIFKYLPQSQLQDSVANVCHKWHRIRQDKSLYSRLLLDAKLSLSKTIGITRRYSAFVHSLVIQDRQDTNEVLKLVPRLTNLRFLMVMSCSGCIYRRSRVTCEIDAELISAILEQNCNLLELRIIYSTIRNGAGIIMSKNNLKKLVLKNLYYQRSIDERGMLSQRELNVLNLQGVIINKSSLCTAILNNQKTLHTVKLDVWEPQLGSNDRIIEAIGTCINLRNLLIRNLSFYCISDQAIQHITTLKQLTTIKFSKIENLTANAFVNLFELPQSKKVQKIHLSACDGVNSLVIKTIAQNCPNLVKLAVHQPKSTDDLITSDDILFLAFKCTKLELLDLCYTHKSIGKSMTKIVSQMPMLRCFKYCINGNWYDEELLTSIHNYLFVNLNNFNVVIKLNIHLDRYIVGTRLDRP